MAQINEREKIYSKFLTHLQDYGIYTEYITRRYGGHKEKQKIPDQHPQYWLQCCGFVWSACDDGKEYWMSADQSWSRIINSYDTEE